MSPALIDQVSTYVISLFNDYGGSDLLYHNLKHTTFVVKKSKEIAHHYSLSENENFILSTAAWFHDTGQLFHYGRDHEAESVIVMKKYLADKQIDSSIIGSIENCILATKMPHKPKSFLEEIICDADTFNLGTQDFLITDSLLKRECELKENKTIDDWDIKTLSLLEHHKYFTTYCRQLLNQGKQENINIIRSRLNL